MNPELNEISAPIFATSLMDPAENAIPEMNKATVKPIPAIAPTRKRCMNSYHLVNLF